MVYDKHFLDMKTTPFILLTFIIGIGLAACSDSNNEVATTEPEVETPVEAAEPDVDSLMVQMNNERLEIEKNREGMEKRSLDTSNLLPIISAKWATVEFYSDESGVRRVKTYPVEGNTRTEEYYFTDGALRCAVAEGLGTEQEEGQSIDGTVFYYYQGELIREMENPSDSLEEGWSPSAQNMYESAMYYLELDSMINSGTDSE